MTVRCQLRRRRLIDYGISIVNAADVKPTFQHGQIDYLQLPALNVGQSAAFYDNVFGWSVDASNGSFQAPGMIGQLTTERQPANAGGPVVWISADDLGRTLRLVEASGGRVNGRPQLDNGERWLTEIDDPAGNRVGIVVQARAAAPQPLIAVADVEASSRWYQELLGLQSDHGGPEYERLLADGVLVLQLHNAAVGHHHGRIGDPARELGNGVLLWFGEVAHFDDVVARAERMEVAIARQPHRNPPDGQGNGPAHREIWITDLDGYTVVVASPDGEAYELTTR
jgi:predicted enzyme related to lactoylglutathione lyase/catechol 2,3-dioxygenase-like lactoylglutathione lyase family enzyme